MEIVFLGTSCMVPTKDRNHVSIFIKHLSEGFLIDCGEGTQRQLKIADISPTKISKILLTHWHGDHVLGLPGLLQTLNSSEFDKKLTIYGPKGTLKSFEYMFKAFSFNLNFEHEIIEIKKDTIIDLKNILIDVKKLEHKVECLGYSLIEKDRRRIKTNVIKKLNIPDGPLLGKLQNNTSITWNNKIISPKDTTYVVKGKKIAIVLDTIHTNNVNLLAKDADVLICEASYTSELKSKADENMHLTAKDAGLIASRNNVKKLILTHLSQRYKTPETILDDVKIIFENSKIAYDFMKMKV